jgi:hypothetical protein
MKPAIEGLLVQGQQGADVGDKLRVKLIRTDSQREYIDFVGRMSAPRFYGQDRSVTARQKPGVRTFVFALLYDCPELDRPSS